MRHKAQVPFNQDISGFQVSLLRPGQVVLFFRMRQWPWERAGVQLQGIQQRAQHQPHSTEHNSHLRCHYIRHCPSHFLPVEEKKRLLTPEGLLRHFSSDRIPIYGGMFMIITNKVKLDLQTPGILPTIHAVQNDSYSRNLEITLFSDRKPFIFPDNGAVVIRYKKSDGKGGEYDTLPDGTAAWRAERNILTVALAPQVLTTPGSVHLSVSLIAEGKQLSIFPIHLAVAPIAAGKIAKSENYFYITGLLPAPVSGNVGQCLRIAAVNAEGRITAVEAADSESFNAATVCSLPVLHLTGDTTGMSKDNAVSLGYVYGEHSGNATVKWQGSSSLGYPKKNYTIQFDNAFEAVEGWGEQKKYCLKANFIDHSHARNVVSAKLWGEIVKSRENMNANLSALPNGGAVDGFPCIVMLNGAFHGLYTFNIPKDGWMYGMGNGGMNVERLSFKEYVDGEIDKTTGEYTPTDRVVAEFVTERNISTAGGRTYINWDVSKVSHIGARAYLFDMDGNLVKAFSGYNGVEWNPYYGNYEGDLGEDAWLDVPANTTRLDEAWEVKPLSLPVPKNHYVMWMFTHNNIAIPETSDLTTAWSAEAEANNTWSYSWARTGIEFTYQSTANEIILCADTNGEATRFKKTAAISDDLDFEIEYTSDGVAETDVKTALNSLINACINSDGTDLDSNIAQYLDWDSAIDYYIFTCLIGGADMAGKNYLLSTYDGTKWFFGAYDMDSTFGLWWDGTQFLPDNHYPTVEWYADYHRAMWLIWNYKRDALKARYAELRAGALSENNVALVFSNFINHIPSTVYMEDAKKWPGIPSTAANNLAQILNWYRMRVAVLDKEMERMV